MNKPLMKKGGGELVIVKHVSSNPVMGIPNKEYYYLPSTGIVFC